MKSLRFAILFLLILPAAATAQKGLDYYLPAGITFNQSIPTPKAILGAEVGEWHVRHDQLVNYMHALAAASDRIVIEEHHRTYENRQGVILTITSPANHRRLESIRAEHVKLADPKQSDALKTESMPIVVNMNYSVHGNEPSGSNASLVVAYYLAAAQGPEIEEMLANTVILLDPSLNPDGLARFAQWANMHKNTTTLTSDGNDREYSEVWPGGRTNHYWFDLNRDWMVQEHPESRGRIKKFYEWRPNILTDHHEMGTNSSFFFQPGIPSRTHPLTPKSNQLLTSAIAEYHADELDKIGSLYFTQESFDDFYYGKGSTYPDVNGSIGILFEQASSRGHLQESPDGLVEFPFTIRNQVRASLSTLKAAQGLRIDLLDHMRTFYKEASQEAANSSIKAYVFGDPNDVAKTRHMADMIHRNNIQVYELKQNVSSGGKSFTPGKAYVVPTNQPQYRLITAMFERRTTFTDSLFYDVSAWTIPYAYGVPFAELNTREFSQSIPGDPYQLSSELRGSLIGGRSNYAYVFEWDEYYAPRAAYRLLSAGVKVKVASLPFTSSIATGTKNFDYGTILVPMGIQSDPEKVHTIIREIIEKDGITAYAVSTGLTPEGIDFGSNNFNNLRKPEIAILAGPGVSSSEVGEAWHMLDTRFNIPITLLEQDRVGRADLSRYNVIVMPGGGYSISGGAANRLKEWVAAGGVLLAYKSAISWAKQQELAKIDFVSRPSVNSGSDTLPYVNQSNDSGAQVIGGAIFNAELDLTHPIAYGYNSEQIHLFRNSTQFMQKGKNPYSTPVRYTGSPLASGYISKPNEETLKNTAAVVVSRYGGGKVITMTDNPNFRAFWYGTNKLFMNAVFFGHTISASTTN